MIGLVTAAVLALAGCMKLDVHLDLQADDTVDGMMTMAFSKDLVELSGGDADELVAEMQRDLFGGTDEDDFGDATVEPYDDETFVGTTMIFQGAPLEQFAKGDADSLTVIREGEEFVVSGVMDLSDDGESEVDTSFFSSGMDVRLAVTFPGDVAEHNGTLDGRTVTWAPKLGDRVEISARGSAVAGAPSVGGSDDTSSGDDAAGVAPGTGDDTTDDANGGAPGGEPAEGSTDGDAAADVVDTTAPTEDDGAVAPWLLIGIGLLALLVIALLVFVIVLLRKQRATPAQALEDSSPPRV